MSTIAEMHVQIDQGLQKNGSFIYSNFLSEEIDMFINKMVLRFIKDRFDRTDPAELGFEEVQKRVDDIRELINVDPVLATPTNGKFDFEADYLFWVSGEAVIGWDDCKLVNDSEKDFSVPLRIIPNNLFQKREKDPFYKSSPQGEFNASIRGSSMIVSEGKYILKQVSYFYVRQPQKVSLSSNIDCELAAHTHDEIVDLTVQHILEVIESPRYQSNSAQVTKTE